MSQKPTGGPLVTVPAPPLSSGGVGRVPSGQFAKGNKVGVRRGNPYAGEVQRRRHAIFASTSPDDVADVFRALVKEAKTGDLDAIREVLDRTIGQPDDQVIFEQLANLHDKVDDVLDENERLREENQRLRR